jgi:hypothetical protein
MWFRKLTHQINLNLELLVYTVKIRQTLLLVTIMDGFLLYGVMFKLIISHIKIKLLVLKSFMII